MVVRRPTGKILPWVFQKRLLAARQAVNLSFLDWTLAASNLF